MKVIYKDENVTVIQNQDTKEVQVVTQASFDAGRITQLERQMIEVLRQLQEVRK